MHGPAIEGPSGGEGDVPRSLSLLFTLCRGRQLGSLLGMEESWRDHGDRGGRMGRMSRAALPMQFATEADRERTELPGSERMDDDKAGGNAMRAARQAGLVVLLLLGISVCAGAQPGVSRPARLAS